MVCLQLEAPLLIIFWSPYMDECISWIILLLEESSVKLLSNFMSNYHVSKSFTLPLKCRKYLAASLWLIKRWHVWKKEAKNHTCTLLKIIYVLYWKWLVVKYYKMLSSQISILPSSTKSSLSPFGSCDRASPLNPTVSARLHVSIKLQCIWTILHLKMNMQL